MARDKKPQLGELVGGPDFCHTSSGIPAEEAGAELNVSKAKIREKHTKRIFVFLESFNGDPLFGGTYSLSQPIGKIYSHSIVPGGLLVISNVTRLIPATSFVIRFEIFASTS